MLLKDVVMEDFIHYKKASMFILFPFCTFKCERECGEHCCQNSALAQSPNIDVDIDTIIKRYLSNPITESIVCGGLEPFDSWEDLHSLIHKLRIDNSCFDDVVIYTGYKKEEILDKVNSLKSYSNIIIKFGRFIPNDTGYYNDILGVTLASSNQYAEVIS